MNASKTINKRLSQSIGFFMLVLSLSHLSWGGGYTMDWDNLNNGIQPESSNTFFMMSSVGQSVTGMMQGGGYILVGGFWTGYYKSGDVTCDGKIDAGDVVFLVNYLFRGGQAPCFWESGDITCDRVIDAGDVVYLINYLFRNGSAPRHCDP
ncbi:MAG: dockerin type I repeat-containing protein [Candidatus Zixiibacteriota bacterium]